MKKKNRKVSTCIISEAPSYSHALRLRERVVKELFFLPVFQAVSSVSTKYFLSARLDLPRREASLSGSGSHQAAKCHWSAEEEAAASNTGSGTPESY